MGKLIKTKIVATVGPASMAPAILGQLIRAGVDVFRINFSHGTEPQHQAMLEGIRAAAEKLRRPVAVMADLCGPKIRVGEMTGGGVLLVGGSTLVIQRKPVVGTPERISTTLAELIDDARVGQRILMDDGRIELKVVRRRPPSELDCTVVTGGVLGTGKGVNLPQTSLKLSALTEKDRRDAAWIAGRDFDYVALSFVRRAADIRELRGLLDAGRSQARIVAKIEKPQALKNIGSIVEAADAVLVARGDLGVEMPMPAVPVAQKRLVQLAEEAGKPCIVATQMLETMTSQPTPTRAEVSDVANAVFDGADAVMLSGETAVGQYPLKAVEMMNDIAMQVERHLGSAQGPRRRLADLGAAGCGPTAAIARAVHTLVHADAIKAVVAYTMTGATALHLAKMRLPAPTLALTPSRRVVQQTCLYYGVAAAEAPMVEHTREVLALAARHILRLRWGRKGDKIIVVSGRPLGRAGATNTLVVHTL
ncbi:MAG: pyruvate kinase [Planctomycetes bacterium]|nr:pyruvate kinase [Planctomycetota bacterium]